MVRPRRVFRITGRAALVSAVAIAALLGPAAPAAADPAAVEGALDYEPLSTSVIDETVTSNTVALSLDTAGGPFLATVSLMIGHDFRDRECHFDSSHEWTVTGEFDPATMQFSGDYVEVTEQTIGACENTEFTRTFDPDEGRFVARLDQATGIITSQIPPLRFELAVDPVILDLLPPAEPDPVEPTPQGQTSSLRSTDPARR